MWNQESPLHREMFESVTKSESALILYADPRMLEFQVRDRAFMMYCKRRLDIPVISSTASKCQLCNAFIDVNFEHPMQCPKISRNVLHHDVNQSVSTLMRKRTNQSSYSYV